jgi:aryl-alcohol dehydrogenase-like predicted oxidoreductase
MSPERLQLSLHNSEDYGYPRYETLQPEYNLYDRRKFETTYAPICREHGLSVLPYYALASGFLSGKYRSKADVDKSPRGSKALNYLNERGMRILAALDAVAARYNTTPASVSIAWLAQRPGIAAPIASATSLEQLDALMKAATLALDQDAVNQLDVASKY